MFTLISFKEDGQPIEHVGQEPAFYGLVYQDTIIEYYLSLNALREALLDMEEILVAQEVTSETKAA